MCFSGPDLPKPPPTPSPPPDMTDNAVRQAAAQQRRRQIVQMGITSMFRTGGSGQGIVGAPQAPKTLLGH